MVPVELMSCQTGDPERLRSHEQSGEWLLEEKFDGERIQAIKKGKGEPVQLFGRSKKEFTHAAPEIVAALEKSRVSSFHFDGEIAYINPALSSEECFSATSSRMRMKHPTDVDIACTPLKYIAFDILGMEGIPLLARKAILLEALPEERGTTEASTLTDSSILYSNPYFENFQGCYNHLIATGKEGAILKRMDSEYQNKRSKDWLKIIPIITEDVIVIDLIPGRGKFKPYFGAFKCLAPNGKEFNAGPGRLGFEKMAKVKAEIESGELEFPFMIEILLKGWQPSGVPRMPRTNRIRYDKEVPQGVLDAEIETDPEEIQFVLPKYRKPPVEKIGMAEIQTTMFDF